MGKSDDDYTPTLEQIAAAEKIVVPLDWTPEQLAAMRRGMADQLREGAEMDRISERLDRYLAIRDGQIRPPWMEQTELKPETPLAEAPEPASEPESAAEPEPLSAEMSELESTADPKVAPEKKRKHYWDDDVDRVLEREEFRDAKEKFNARDVLKKVREALESKIKESGRTISRSLILRKTGHWKP